jgi:hypothetical protein
MATLDSWYWHPGNEVVDDSVAEECFATHIGFYLEWIIKSGLWKGREGIDVDTDLVRLKSGEITGRDFLTSQLDGKLMSDFFTAEGEKFSQHYYDKYLVGPAKPLRPA